MAKKPGRNAPCLCGSGVKYKRCCGRGATPWGGHYTEADRESALTKLAHFLDDPDWAEVIEEAEDLFWDSVHGDTDLPAEAARAANVMSSHVFDTWLVFDLELDDGYIIDRFLETERVSPGERRYLTAMKSTSMRVYEVIGVEPGASITLRDVFDGTIVLVRERSASQQLACWEWVAARVNPTGASRQPEFDGGLLQLAPLVREQLVEAIQEDLEWLAEHEPELDERQRWATLVPLLHGTWRSPVPLPTMVNYDGDPLVWTTAHFEILDRESLVAALDASPSLERVPDGDNPASTKWSWSGTGRDREEPVVLGWFELGGERLELHANSVERAQRGRKFVARIAKDFVKYQVSVSEDVRAAIERGRTEGPASATDELPPEVRAQLLDATEAFVAEHYERWVDEQVPSLDGRTPREAAKGGASERARVLELIKGLEHAYEQALASGEGSYDPTWIVDELELGADLDAMRSERPPPQVAHASAVEPMPAAVAVAKAIAARLRSEGASLEDTISASEIDRDLGARSFIREREDVDDPARDELRDWLTVLCNFELQLCKLFWVDESLAWSLGATEIELTGKELGLPFVSFALVFCDRYALGLAERMLSREPGARRRGRMLRSLTVYVTRSSQEEGDVRRVQISFACDAHDGRLPCMVGCELVVRPDADLDEILDAATPRGGPKRCLLHLVTNAILYASSLRPSSDPAPGERSKPTMNIDYLASDEVYVLPGTIDIGSLAQLKRLHRASPKRRSILQRTLVRGHWRRAAEGWTDQRARWIAPHWRGPTNAAIIERPYRLEP